MLENYQYPLDLSWTATEMATVIAFFHQVEIFYEGKVDRNKFMSTYRDFKEIVVSKSQEKQLDRQFEEVSGYSAYHAIKSLSNKIN